MEQLQQLIAKVAGLNALELRQMRFKYPQKGLIQAIRLIQGEEAGEKLLQLVAKECSVDLLSGEQIQIDQSLIQASGNEISRLGFALKALPLKIAPTAQGEVLLLAMSDPTDTHTKAVFQTLFSKPIKPLLAREDELLEALRFQIPSGARGAKILKSTKPPEGEPAHVNDALKELISKVVEISGRELHFEILGANIVASLHQTFDRKVPINCNLTPDDLFSGLIARARICKREGEAISGVAHLAMLPTGADFEFEYQPEFKSESGEKGRKLIISNISVKEPNDPMFWSCNSRKALESLRETLDAGPGLYLGAFPVLEQQPAALSAIQRLYPDLHVLKEIQELSSDPDTAKRLKYSRVILPLKSQSVAQVTKSLQKAPPALRALIKGIFSYTELKRPCSFCLEDIPAAAKTLSLFPEALHPKLQLLKYPRGCPVCKGSGYLGETALFSFSGTKENFGQGLREGKTAKELVPVLRKEGWIPITEVALEQALIGDTVLEQVADVLLGATSSSLTPLASEFNSELTPLEQSRIYLTITQPTNQADFHSVVLDVGGDLLAAREALMAESAGLFDTHEESKPKPPVKADPAKADSASPSNSSAFHSVVLDLDGDMKSMRERLLAEMDDD